MSTGEDAEAALEALVQVTPRGTHGGDTRRHEETRHAGAHQNTHLVFVIPSLLSSPLFACVLSSSQRTTDVYAALLQREIPNRDAEFNCGRSYLEADRPDLAEEIFRREKGGRREKGKSGRVSSMLHSCAHSRPQHVPLSAGLLEAGYKPTDSRFRLCQSLFDQALFVEGKLELQKLLQDDPDHAEGLEFAQHFEEHVNKEGKIFIYGLLGLGAMIGLFLAYQRSKTSVPSTQ